MFANGPIFLVGLHRYNISCFCIYAILIVPMFTSPATPALTLTTKLPVPKFVLAVVPSIIIESLRILPVTSNASEVLLIHL